MESKSQLVISMVPRPIHLGRPWASCNLYALDAFKMPMMFLEILSISLQTPDAILLNEVDVFKFDKTIKQLKMDPK